jgi:hypothetical protein
MPRKELTIEELWKRYLRTKSVALRNKIVVHYSPLVHAAGVLKGSDMTLQE